MSTTEPPSFPAVHLVPEEIMLDCPSCGTTHWLRRGLDFEEDREGVWRLNERPGFLCDCGAALLGDFTVAAENPAPSDTRSLSVSMLLAGSYPARR